MRGEIQKRLPIVTRENFINRNVTENFLLSNLPKSQIELKISSNIILKSPPKDILKQIINENTFQNPIYKSNEENGRSNWQTDPTITTYSYKDEILILPRGYMRDLLKIFRANDVTPQIIDGRSTSPCIYPNELKGITLRQYQQRAIEEALRFDQGVILAPTGSGKSIIGLELIRKHNQNAIICVHRADLARQWKALIKERLGIVPGFIGNGDWEIGQVTIAMIQSLASQENQTKNLSDKFGLILLDEHHHAPAESTFHVLGLLSAKFRYGLSASKRRRDGLEIIVNRAIGHEIALISKMEVEAVGGVVPATVVSVQTNFNPGCLNSWHDYLESITYDSYRNLLIINLAQKSDSAALILVDRVSHAEQLSEMLTRRNIDHVLAHGQLCKKDRENVMERIKIAKLTVGTTSLLGEGLDVDVWDTLIMGSPISSEIKLMQAIGRIVRPFKGKEKALVYDLNDDCSFSGSSFKKRFVIYKKNGIWVDFNRSKTLIL